MDRTEYLNKHLETLTLLNTDGQYQDMIDITLDEINQELGITGSTKLSSYSTKELHEELVKRTGVYETAVNLEEEVIVTIVTGQQDETKSFSGPARILVNQD